MDINIDALNWITGYDLTNQKTMLKHNIKNVNIVVDNILLPSLFITKFDGTTEKYIINYNKYYEYLRNKKLQKIIHKIGTK